MAENNDLLLLIAIPLITIFLERIIDYAVEREKATLNNRPYIQCLFRDYTGKVFTTLSIKNIGNTQALKVSIKIKTSLKFEIEGAISNKREKEKSFYEFYLNKLDVKEEKVIELKNFVETENILDQMKRTKMKISCIDLNEKKFGTRKYQKLIQELH